MITVALCLCSLSIFGQVEINTQSPAATLDVTSRTTGTATAVPEGLIAPRLTIADLNAKVSAYGAAQAGSMIYVTDAANGIPAGQTANINAAGYYFFDGTGWLKVITGNAGSTGSSNDIYNGDGALTANRTVAMSDKTLAFSASPTSGTSHFTIDDTTLSVDALNNRVGIGTNTPSEKLQIENGNLFMKNEHPALYFQATAAPSFYQDFNVDYGPIMFYRNQNSPANWMYIRHMHKPIGYMEGNQLQFGVLDNGTYNPVMNITNLKKQVLIGTNTIPTAGQDSKVIINNGTMNGALQILDGTQGNNKVLTSDRFVRLFM